MKQTLKITARIFSYAYVILFFAPGCISALPITQRFDKSIEAASKGIIGATGRFYGSTSDLREAACKGIVGAPGRLYGSVPELRKLAPYAKKMCCGYSSFKEKHPNASTAIQCDIITPDITANLDCKKVCSGGELCSAACSMIKNYLPTVEKTETASASTEQLAY